MVKLWKKNKKNLEKKKKITRGQDLQAPWKIIGNDQFWFYDHLEIIIKSKPVVTGNWK